MASIAFGIFSTSNAQQGILIGDNGTIAAGATTAAALGSAINIGANAVAAVAVGNQSNVGANAVAAVAIGNQSIVSAAATNAVAIGSKAQATLTNAVALGQASKAQGTASLAAGSAATAGADNAMALGSSASVGAGAAGAVALGQSAAVSANATNAVSIGPSSQATKANAVALGQSSKSQGTGSLAVGSSAIAAADNSVAVGANANAAFLQSIAIGRAATTGSALSIAIGDAATTGATGQNVAIGSGGTTANSAAATGGAVAIGRTQTAKGNGAVAIGDPNTANGTGAVAVGEGNVAAGSADGSAAATGAVAIGSGNSALGNGAVALGSGSQAQAAGALALGNAATAKNANDVALGSGAVTDAAVATASTVINGTTYNFAGTAPGSVVSVGANGAERQLINVAAGRLTATSTDAVNGSQLFATNSEVGAVNDRAKALGADVASAVGGGSTYDLATGKLTAPAYNVGGTTYSNVGDALAQLANGGAKAKYFSANSTGADSTATGADSVAIGTGATAANAGDVALGANSTTGAAVATASTVINGTTYDFAGTAPVSVVSVGAVGAERQITNVAAGRLTADSTDAINGSQLFATNTELGAVNDRAKALGADVASAVGGGSTYDPATGKLTAPAYNVGGTTYSNVGDALAQLASGGAKAKYFNANSTLADSIATGTDAVAIGPNAVANNAGDVALGSGAVTGAAVATASTVINGTTYDFAGTAPGSVVSVGAVGAERQITNVAAGRLAADSTDAINGSQLFATNTELGAVNDRAKALGADVASAVGGGSSYDPATGKLTAPAYNVGGTTYNNVGDALSQLANGGAKAKYFNANSTGADSIATGTDSVAIGPNAVANNTGDVALGSGSVTGAAVGTASAVIHGTAYNFAGATPGSVVSVGAVGAERLITNVAAGRLAADSTDAVNGSQLFATNTEVGNLGSQLDQINNGGGIKYVRINSTDPDAVAGGLGSVAIGPNASSAGARSLAIGAGASAAADDSVALGAGSVAAAATAVSGGTIAGTAYAYAGANPVGTVSVGSAGAERQLSNVAAGRVAADSTDAVNGSQLHATNQAVDKLDVRVGAVEGRVGAIETDIDDIRSGAAGPFRISADRAAGAPSANGANSIAGGSNAVAAGDASMALGNDAAATAAGAVALGNGSIADRANTVSVGSAGNERQIANVAAGTNGTDAVNLNQLKAVTSNSVHYDSNRDGSANTTSLTFNRGGAATGLHNVAAGVADTDAVNLGQLNRGLQDNLGQANAYTDRKTAELQGDLWNMRRDMRGGVAAALAVAGLPQAYLPGKRMAAMALGSYQGESGIAIGVSGVTEDGHVVYKLQGTGNTSSGWGGSVGVGYQW
ncbi:YadA family autotransporter adhesin [Lysobacter enzymogenes]|uniref:YadA family autotransporter adhesin n=1 Tax=Lysobacter enzymogenes TaxID=69 RepID=UPI00384AD71F